MKNKASVRSPVDIPVAPAWQKALQIWHTNLDAYQLLLEQKT